MDIEEMIADAKAEEEVKNDMFSEYNIESADNSKVTIDLSEYVMLKMESLDLNRILSAIVDDIKSDYDSRYISFEKSITINTFKALFGGVFEAIKEEMDKEG